MKNTLQDIVLFFRRHWVHLLLAVPAAVAFTSLHELAHCAAVWMQGGQVTEFVWLPSGEEWGHMNYSFPPGTDHSETMISLAPYACWILLCLVAGLLSVRNRPWPFWAASGIFVWLFIVPLADIANAAIPYAALDSYNDLRSAFGPRRLPAIVGLAALGVLSVGLGFFLQKRLYRETAVGLPAYLVLALSGALALLVITSLRFG